MRLKPFCPSASTSKKLLILTFLSAVLVFSLLLVAGNSANTKDPETKAKPDTGAAKIDTARKVSETDADVVSIAAIRKLKDGKTVKVLFNEKEQIFTLNVSEKPAQDLLRTLEEAYKNKKPLKLAADPHRATIKSVAVPTEKEMKLFLSIRKELLKSEKPLTIDLKKIDTAKFDDIKNLPFPVWKLCTKIVPSYDKAKEIFDYCAKQSCNLPGPYDIPLCIPFQYVRDGCYARAHKMKWIITNHFGYCSEKVFSFANQNDDELAVVASKWGGCCVMWWYHVAPVIRVKITAKLKGKNISLVLAYVIDPGMFDKPVPLSTWLSAQANATCSPHAKVSAYTIQPASAYTPANYQGTAFTTDPAYASTDATLIAYKNLKTCP